MKSNDLLLCVVRMRIRGYSWDEIQCITGGGIVLARQTYFNFRTQGVFRRKTVGPRQQRSDKIFNATALAHLDADVYHENDLYLDERADRIWDERLQNLGHVGPPSTKTVSRAMKVRLVFPST